MKYGLNKLYLSYGISYDLTDRLEGKTWNKLRSVRSLRHLFFGQHVSVSKDVNLSLSKHRLSRPTISDVYHIPRAPIWYVVLLLPFNMKSHFVIWYSTKLTIVLRSRTIELILIITIFHITILHAGTLGPKTELSALL